MLWNVVGYGILMRSVPVFDTVILVYVYIMYGVVR